MILSYESDDHNNPYNVAPDETLKIKYLFYISTDSFNSVPSGNKALRGI